MAITVNDKDLGMVTAYAYALAGGYTGTEAEFEALLGKIAEDLAQIENLSVQVQTLPAGSDATASYAEGVLTLGIPRGDKGETGDQGEIGPTPQLSVGTVTTGEPGTDAEVEITGTTEAPVLNFTIPRGDTGNITQAVRYDAAQTLTDAQKEQARANIGAADAGDVADLKSALNQIATVEQERDEIIYHKDDLNDSYDSTYVNEGYISETGNFTANSSYRTYYYQVTEDSEIWAHSDFSMFFALSVYNTAVNASSFVVRYNRSQGTMPTEENKLAVTAGQWLVFSFGHSSSQNRDFNFYTGLYNTSIEGVFPTTAFVKAINEQIELPIAYIGKATKTATSLVVNLGKLKYEVNKYNVSTIRAYLWRTNACRVLDDNGAYQTVWVDSDSDGVVKISGEADFVGGYHGDETETLFKLFIDGVEYAEDSTFTDKPFNEIILYFESNVYHCNTSSTPDVVAFKRNKIIKFNDEGYTVENYWTAQENITCEIAYIGMLSINNGLINGYHTNYDFKYCALGDSGAERQANRTDVCFNTPYGDIGMKVSEAIPNIHYGCVVSAYTGRLKVYASCFNSSAHGSLSTGDVIKGKAVTYFK